jgi:hypothetical protein
MLTTYGYKVLPKDDPFQEIVEEGNTALCESVNPDASLVNVLPFLRFLPSWFPGADFHHVAQVMNKKVVRMVEVPYKYVQDNLVCLWLNSHLNIFLTYFVAICYKAAGTASPSFVASLLETCESEEDHIILKEVAATAYGGM